MDFMNDKLSIKNLLFTKALPNHVIPVPTTGFKIYSCTDCGDKFIFESSYEHHVNRKSVKISYMCRHCGLMKIFFNRCNLLSHIRSHSFKTATINVVDLKIDPLPISHFKMNLLLPQKNDSPSKKTKLLGNVQTDSPSTLSTCYECKENITNVGPIYKDRANHYMRFTNEVYTCPVCLFALPTVCGLQSHIRIHMKIPPYFCPECGCHLPNRNVSYPYNHDCEGFKMMRATARLQCPVTKSHNFHPNDYKEHMKSNHLKKVYKCPFCVVACFNEATMTKHLKIHKTNLKAIILYQCEMCPGRLVLQNHMDPHLKNHVNTNVFPCWTCGTVCQDLVDLITHNANQHSDTGGALHNLFSSLMAENNTHLKKQRIYRVVKRCDQCRRSFIYKCKRDEIGVLPNLCPYKCSSSLQSNIESETLENNNSHLICHLCRCQISQDWNLIKEHYAAHHKKYKCLDAKLLIPKLDIKKYLPENKTKNNKTVTNTIKKNTRSRKRRMSQKDIQMIDDSGPVVSTIENIDLQICKICSHKSETKESLENHLVIHRDPCMAYQCLECGQSFVVKPSFSTHLLLEHSITNVEDYIKNKQCYNENAMSKYKPNENNNEPLKENQCNICREQFDNSEVLEKHYRVHGMAFLKKNTPKKNNL
ncbi:hypothetical protein O3G_MSEX001325 [Manduca sexta]|uniref:C2H2-type domain-containing protein n=1 Tax=Manduca sexta TaxID=7130 RepID=A0A922CAT6_MANSE|nr:hypothetical protein O3G_MSEX001325 [Manduca sexta]KAG6440497.1 hypothetical protein O3G_MSEX001325 [Manduca sexta]